MKRIEGCNHTLERMTEWAQESACPICLTAACGMLQNESAALRSQLADAIRERDALRREYDTMHHSLSAMIREKDAARAELAEAKREREGTVNNLRLGLRAVGLLSAMEWPSSVNMAFSLAVASQGMQADLHVERERVRVLREAFGRAEKVAFDTYSNAQKLPWQAIEENCKQIMDIYKEAAALAAAPAAPEAVK